MDLFSLGDVKKRALQYVSRRVLHESKNIRKILDACLSAFTSDPINIIVEGPPSEGKTHLIINTASVFPERFVEIYRDASPKSFTREKGQTALKVYENGVKKFNTRINNRFTNSEMSVSAYLKYLDTELNKSESNIDKEELLEEKEEITQNLVTLIDLENKIIIFLDRPQPELWRSLLSVLSHDSYFTETIFVEGVGKLYTKHVVFKGWPAFIFATTKDEIVDFHDLESRFEVVEPVMSAEKYTDAISAKVNDQFSVSKSYEAELSEIRSEVGKLIDHMLGIPGKLKPILPMKPDEVFKLLFNVENQKIDEGPLMRKIPRLFSHIGVNCLWHLNERVILLNRREEYVVIAADDLGSILNIYDELEINAILAGFPVSIYEFFSNVLTPAFHDPDAEGYDQRSFVQQKEIARELADYVNSKKQTYLKANRKALWGYLKFLEGRGFIEREKDEKDKRVTNISLIVEPEDVINSFNERMEKICATAAIRAPAYLDVLLTADFSAFYRGKKICANRSQKVIDSEKLQNLKIPEMTENAVRPIDTVLWLSGYSSTSSDLFAHIFPENGVIQGSEENSSSLSNTKITESQKSASHRDAHILGGEDNA